MRLDSSVVCKYLFDDVLEGVGDVWPCEHTLQSQLALDPDGGDVTHLQLHGADGQDWILHQLAFVHQVT